MRSQTNATVRIGISEEHRQPAELLKAYQEACAALDAGDTLVSFFSDPKPQDAHPSEVMVRLVKAFRNGTSVSIVMREFLALVMPSNHSPAEIQQSRALLTWAIEHLALETISSGVDPMQIKAAKEKATTSVLHAPSPFGACEAFRRFADLVSQQMTSAFSQREHKVVQAVSQLVEELGAAQITIQQLAEAVHLSCGHLSRVFRRTTGMTLEEVLDPATSGTGQTRSSGSTAQCRGSGGALRLLQSGLLRLGLQEICEVHASGICQPATSLGSDGGGPAVALADERGFSAASLK